MVLRSTYHKPIFSAIEWDGRASCADGEKIARPRRTGDLSVELPCVTPQCNRRMTCSSNNGWSTRHTTARCERTIVATSTPRWRHGVRKLPPLQNGEPVLLKLDGRSSGRHQVLCSEVTRRTGHMLPPDDPGDEVVPPDDPGDEVVPPDDPGDEVVPPDDPGDEVVPPDDPVDEVVPPDDPVDEVVPPDDPGDEVVPPDDPGDEVVPPDDPGDEVVPPDDPVDEVVPPDDPGDEVLPPDDPGDEVLPPDDPGDEVVPPDDPGGEVVPPDDPGNEVLPPDDPLSYSVDFQLWSVLLSVYSHLSLECYVFVSF